MFAELSSSVPTPADKNPARLSQIDIICSTECGGCGYSGGVNYDLKCNGSEQNGAPFDPTQGRRRAPLQGTGNGDDIRGEGIRLRSSSYGGRGGPRNMRFCETNPNCLREITGGCTRAVKTYDAQMDF